MSPQSQWLTDSHRIFHFSLFLNLGKNVSARLTQRLTDQRSAEPPDIPLPPLDYTPPQLSSVTSLTTHPWDGTTAVMSAAKIYLEFLFTSNCIRKMKGSLAKLERRRDERAAEETLLGMKGSSHDTRTHNPIRKLRLPISKME